LDKKFPSLILLLRNQPTTLQKTLHESLLTYSKLFFYTGIGHGRVIFDGRRQGLTEVQNIGADWEKKKKAW
jgi:hypothetical protein